MDGICIPRRSLRFYDASNKIIIFGLLVVALLALGFLFTKKPVIVEKESPKIFAYENSYLGSKLTLRVNDVEEISGQDTGGSGAISLQDGENTFVFTLNPFPTKQPTQDFTFVLRETDPANPALTDFAKKFDPKEEILSLIVSASEIKPNTVITKKITVHSDTKVTHLWDKADTISLSETDKGDILAFIAVYETALKKALAGDLTDFKALRKGSDADAIARFPGITEAILYDFYTNPEQIPKGDFIPRTQKTSDYLFSLQAYGKMVHVTRLDESPVISQYFTKNKADDALLSQDFWLMKENGAWKLGR